VRVSDSVSTYKTFDLPTVIAYNLQRLLKSAPHFTYTLFNLVDKVEAAVPTKHRHLLFVYCRHIDVKNCNYSKLSVTSRENNKVMTKAGCEEPMSNKLIFNGAF